MAWGAGTDSYYEYLIKYWVLGGRQDEHWRRRWEASVDEALEKLVVTPPGWPFSFAGDMRGEQVDSVLEHLRCFYPGSVALGVMSGAVQGPKAERYLQFAANMTQGLLPAVQYHGLGWVLLGGTGWGGGGVWDRLAPCFIPVCTHSTVHVCVFAWARLPLRHHLPRRQPHHHPWRRAGLGAERINFDLATGQISIVDGRYWQRPEVRGWRAQLVARRCSAAARLPAPAWRAPLRDPPAPAPAGRGCPQVIESIFYMWRATKDPKWRDMGWQMW